VKKAYKELALKHHPDRNGGTPESESRFREIAEAYSALSSYEKNKEKSSFKGYESIFKEQRGRKEYSSSSFKSFWDTIKTSPKIINSSVNITFNESIKGAEKKIEYSFKKACAECSVSTGSSLGQSACPQCHGSGKMKQHQGYVTLFTACRNCKGSGRVRATDCNTCGGLREVNVDVRTILKIPEGVVSGNVLRLVSEDKNIITMVKVIVEKSDEFSRIGNDIFSNLEVTLKEALLGCTKEISLVRRKCSINIPECISAGTKIRVKGEGACTVSGKVFGDHFIKISIKMPKKLTEMQKNAIKSLED
jgi:molecular chaperone DnaJ